MKSNSSRPDFGSPSAAPPLEAALGEVARKLREPDLPNPADGIKQ